MSIEATQQKLVKITPPGAIADNVAWTTTEIDTREFEHCTIYCHLGASDVAVATLKVQESDVSGSGFTDVSGLVFGTSTNTNGTASTLPSATDDNGFFSFDIDLRGRKRYLDLSAVAGNGTTGTYMTAWAVLSRANTTPLTASERGLTQGLSA